MKESSRFYSSLGLLILLNIIIKPVWIFGIDRKVQNIVGTETYGTYFSLFGFSIVFSFLLDWGFTSFFNRELAANKTTYINKAGSFFLIKLIFSVFYVLVVFVAAWLAGVGHWDIVGYVVMIQVLTSLFLFARSIISAEQWFFTDAWLSVTDKLLMILVCGSFLVFPSVVGNISIQIFLITQAACTTMALIISSLILYKNGFSFSFHKFPLPDTRLIKSVLPFGMIVLLMSAHYRLDGFLLERLHHNGAYEAGIYAGAYRLLDAANMIGFLLASFLLPFIARLYSPGKSITAVVINCRHLLLLFSMVISIAVFMLAPWVQGKLYHNQNETAITVLRYCLPALVGYSLVQIYGTVLTATGHIMSFCIIVFASVIINVLLNLFLVPSFGALGSCYAALISHSFCGIATLIYASIKEKIRIDFFSFFLYVAIAGIMAGFLYFGQRYISNNWLLLAGFILITFIASIASKLIVVNNWKIIFKQTDQS